MIKMRTVLLLLFVTTLLHAESFQSIRVIKPAKSSDIVNNIAALIQRQISERCSAKVVLEGDAPFTLELDVRNDGPADGFSVTDRAGGAKISGNANADSYMVSENFCIAATLTEMAFRPAIFAGAVSLFAACAEFTWPFII